MIGYLNLKEINNRHSEEISTAIQRVVDSGWFILGNEVRAFENEYAQYIGTNYCVGCGNGSDAIALIVQGYFELGKLKPGDEVLIPANTYIGTILPLTSLGLKVKLIEPNINTLQIDDELIEAQITDKTKAVVIVHLYGKCAFTERIAHLCKLHNLLLIEDNAQAIGADFIFSDGTQKKAGTIGTIGTTSFFPSKNLGCYGDGGAIFTNDDDLAYKLRGIVNHGMYKRYYHDEVGVNSRLDSVQAAILRRKLPHLDTYNEARRKAANFYDEAFAGHPHLLIPKREENSTHVFHQYTLRVLNGKRNELQEFLASKEIPAMIYYPVALRKQKAYFQASNDADFKNTDKLLDQVISLPMHTELDEEQLKYITESVLEFMNS